MTKPKIPPSAGSVSTFGLGGSLVIRHLSFVISIAFYLFSPLQQK
jgi:hypothetical protein